VGSKKALSSTEKVPRGVLNARTGGGPNNLAHFCKMTTDRKLESTSQKQRGKKSLPVFQGKKEETGQGGGDPQNAHASGGENEKGKRKGGIRERKKGERAKVSQTQLT